MNNKVGKVIAEIVYVHALALDYLNPTLLNLVQEPTSMTLGSDVIDHYGSFNEVAGLKANRCANWCRDACSNFGG
jgi:hypothetical protein